MLTPSPIRSPSEFLDDVTEVNANSDLNTLVVGQACIALSQPVKDFLGATHRFDDAAKFGDRPVTKPFHKTTVMDRDCRIDEFAAQRPQPSQRPLFVCLNKPAVANDVGDQDRSDFSRTLPQLSNHQRVPRHLTYPEFALNHEIRNWRVVALKAAASAKHVIRKLKKDLSTSGRRFKTTEACLRPA